MPQLLLIDNYDSFTYNLVHLIEKVFDGEIFVARNDEIDLNMVDAYDIIVLSPGPKLPKETGVMMDMIHHYHAHKPFVGICLGMQGIAEYFGSTLSMLHFPEHGQSKKMRIIRSSEVFSSCPIEFNVGRYHSWGVQLNELSSSLVPLSVDDNQWVMSMQHAYYKIYGLQYHPESFLTEYGEIVMKNILNAVIKSNL